MTTAKNTRKRKPRKPYPSFPLWASGNGQWCKKINGRRYFFGVWAKPDEALARYKAERVYLETGTTLKDESAVTIKRVINDYLNRLECKVDDGERSQRHFADCQRTAKVIVETLDRTRLVSDLNGSDFFTLRRKFATKQNGRKASPATVQGHIRRTVAIFTFAINEGLVDRVIYGADFKGVSKKEQTQLENRSAGKLLDAESICKLLDAANYRFKAMILLGLNCAMGNRDIAMLEFDDLDLSGGWYQTDREKTSVRRCAKLWPETVVALQTVYKRRFDPKDKADANRVFITRHGQSFEEQTLITNLFRKLAKKAGVKLPAGAGFYTLRHTNRTVADELSDLSAIRWILGHKRKRTEDRYIHKAPLQRIEAVTDHVRSWLIGGVR